jgi:hypothetical protein
MQAPDDAAIGGDPSGRSDMPVAAPALGFAQMQVSSSGMEVTTHLVSPRKVAV